jgi:GT2 family glycosyltransferase
MIASNSNQPEKSPQPVALAILRRVRAAVRTRIGRGRRAFDATTNDQEVALLLQSRLFHPAWYASISGCDPDPVAAAMHYLEQGSTLNFSPHPLFNQEHFIRGKVEKLGERNPLVAYLTDRSFRGSSTHPLFHVRFYLDAHPEALKHRYGVLGHYVERGARAGFAVNSWYRPDPEAEPGGLAEWLHGRRQDWLAQRAPASSQWSAIPPEASEIPASSPAAAATLAPAARAVAENACVSVVLPAGPAVSLLDSAVSAVLAQTVANVELLVVYPSEATAATEAALVAHLHDGRLRLIATDGPDEAAALKLGALQAHGEWLAFCLPTALWHPHHLENVLRMAELKGADAAYDVVKRTEADGTAHWATTQTSIARACVQSQVFLGALVVRRSAFEMLGGIDANLHSGAGYDLELRLLAHGPLPLTQSEGVIDDFERRRTAVSSIPLRERTWLDYHALSTWRDVALERHLVRWSEINPMGEQNTVSVIVPTYADSSMTVRAVRRVREAYLASVEADRGAPVVEILVVDNGCEADTALALDTLPLRYPGVQVLREPVNRGFALANNVAVSRARGEVLVFLNNDTEVRQGWLEPLVRALKDPTVHGAQSLLVYPTGSIQSAGIAFPACGGIPHALLNGFPVEDADGIEHAELHAATAAALAMRREDVIMLRGFDPIFRNGMEDVDLGLRMSTRRSGRFVVRPDSVVVHQESRTQGRFADSLANRRVLLDRYGDDMPADDIELWRGRGYDVVAHEIRNVVSEDRRIAVPEPVLARRPLVQIDEGYPRLRWALKNPAPAGPEAERWGDTHFIRGLAMALRRLGQQVVVDHRAAFERRSGCYDDVVLVLRGLAPYRPAYGQVSMVWVISHPEMFSRREAVAYDLVFAASVPWSRRVSAEWGIRIDPLLQATDPALFHPDRGRPDTGHPVLFVGGSRKKLRPLVQDAVASGLPLSIYGNDWEGLVPQRCVKATYLPNEQVGEAYRRAGVVLNDHWEDMRRDGFLSNRLFDAAASGARIITDDVQGLEGLFGRSVHVARSADELVKIAGATDLDAAFGGDDERRAVAERVRSEHSFDARARVLVDAAVELRAGRSWSGTRDQEDSR